MAQRGGRWKWRWGPRGMGMLSKAGVVDEQGFRR